MVYVLCGRRDPRACGRRLRQRTWSAAPAPQQAALRGWEDAVKARDARLAALQEREKLILTKLTEAVKHAEAATARAEEMRVRIEEGKKKE